MTTARHQELLSMLDVRLPRRGEDTTRLGLERMWVANIFFFAGKQHFAFLGNHPAELARKKGEIRYKANFIRPDVLRAMTKVLNIQGRFAAVPDGASMDARDMARMSDAVFQHLRGATAYQHKKAIALLWAACCGSVFFKNVFDPSMGETDRFYLLSATDRKPLPAKVLSEEQRKERDLSGLFEDLPTGEVSCEVVSPFQIHEDRISKDDVDQCRWIIQQQWLPKEWVAERYNVDEKDLQTETNLSQSNRFEDAIAMLSTGTSGFEPLSMLNDKQRENRVRLVQMWERPSRKEKRGRFVVYGGPRVLVDTYNRYVADRTNCLHLPFVKMNWATLPGRFWGLSLVEDLTNLQVRYNESRARHAEFEHTFGRPITILPKGAGLSKLDMEIKTAGIYEANVNAGTPIFFPQPTLPDEVMQNASKVLGEMRAISSQSDIDGSKLPGQIRSGLGLRTMQRERDIVLDITIQNSLEADRKCGQQFLTLARLFYKRERLVKMRGSNGEWAVKHFQASDLLNEVRILGEPGEYETSEQYQNRILDFLNSGMLQPATNPQHAQIIAKAIKFHTAEEIQTDLTQHEERQEKEIRVMVADPSRYVGANQDGSPRDYPVLPFEDDIAHQRVLERVFNSEEFEAFDPVTKSVLATHWQLHEQQKQRKLMAQMQMIQATQGTPGKPGVASQPRS